MKIYICDEINNADIDFWAAQAYKLPLSRLEQANKYTKNFDKAICVLSFLLLSAGLLQHGIKNNEIEFKYTINSKPYLFNNDIFFNISHTDSLIACGISQNECGIDTEKIKPFKQKLAERVCTPDELDYIENAADKQEAFADIWTKKESYIKYKGLNIGMDLKSVDKLIKTENLYISKHKYKNHIISSCLQNKEKIHIQILSPYSLMSH